VVGRSIVGGVVGGPKSRFGRRCVPLDAGLAARLVHRRDALGGELASTRRATLLSYMSGSRSYRAKRDSRELREIQQGPTVVAIGRCDAAPATTLP
jgi:hypothetical protein